MVTTYQARKLEEMGSQEEYNEDENSKETLPESSEIPSNPNQFNNLDTKNNEIINIGIINSSFNDLTSHFPSQQQSFSRHHDNPASDLSLHISQIIQPSQEPTPAATPTQKLSPRVLSISEQTGSQSRPELRSLMYSHQHLPLQQQYPEHTFIEGQTYLLQPMIQSQVSLGQMVPISYCPQYLFADDGQVIQQQQIEQPSTSFLQPYQPQSSNVQSVLHHQHNVQRKQPMSEDERQKHRLERNRDAAKRCRNRKKEYVLNLESKLTRLEEENAKLRREILELNTKLQQYPVNIQESKRLYLLLEELKAKLCRQHQQSNQLSQQSLQKPLRQQQQFMNKVSNSSLKDVTVKDQM
ncbi:hypothetical protein C1645_752805 [Glomus cerebriforme]|uniref:BZIP domain-containing protein n=1 Tax=Glomus cerebriforme TaxID=658196 RepID=A0A397TIM2_9GLOM|nr:hypothetical protein C1645_752805 [Glomus cerebriforme]